MMQVVTVLTGLSAEFRKECQQQPLVLAATTQEMIAGN